MRVATYTQPSAVTRSSAVGLLVLVLTILLGSTTLLHIAQVYAPAFTGIVTLLWLMVYAAAFLGLMLGHGINWISWLVRYRMLLVILMVGTVASVAWSLDPRVSVERSVHMVGCTLLAIYIGFTVPLLNTLRVLAVVLGALLIASALSALLLPELGIEIYEGSPVWRGVISSKNGLGFWAAIGVLLYITLSDATPRASMRLLYYIMASVSLAVLVFSQSATSLLGMVVAGALSLYLFLAARFKLGFARMAVLAVIMTGLVVLVVSNVSTAELIGRSDDLTGRGEVWRQTWSLIMQRPATGYGYGVLWFPSPDTEWIQQSLTDFTWIVHHAHNGFLQVASGIGLPLAAIALLMVAQQLIEIIYCQYQRQQVGVLFVLAFTVTYLITNYSEARFLVNRELFWILFIALPISMLRQINLVSPAPVEGVAPAPEPSAPGTWEAAAARMAEQEARFSAPVVATATTGAAVEALAATPASHDTTGSAAEQSGENILDDEDYANWTEEDFDSTINALTLADADIDLGLTDAGVAANDASVGEPAVGAEQSPENSEMNKALDDLFAAHPIDSSEAPASTDVVDDADDRFEKTLSDNPSSTQSEEGDDRPSDASSQ